MTHPVIPALSDLDLGGVCGGAKLDFAAVRAQAQAHCPSTAARYANVSPGAVTRPIAQKLGNECLAEMGSFKAAFARGAVQSAIDQAFPR